MRIAGRFPLLIALLGVVAPGRASGGEIPVEKLPALLPEPIGRALRVDGDGPLGPLRADAQDPPNPTASDGAAATNPAAAQAGGTAPAAKSKNGSGFLFYWHRPGATGHRYVFPFYFHWWDQPRQKDQVVVGPYYQRHDARGSFHMLFPLVYSLGDREAQTRTTWLFPVAGLHTSPTTRAAYVGPFYGWRGARGWAGGLFPLLMMGRVEQRWHGVLFPVFFGGGDERSSTYVVGPTYFKKHRALDAAGPGWDAGLVPIFFAGRHRDRSYFSLLGIFDRVANANGQTTVIGPFYGSRRTDGYAWGLAPLFNFSRSGTRKVEWFLPPLYLHGSDSADRTLFTSFGPVFRARTEAGQVQGIFPILWDVDRGPTHAQALPPLFFHYRNDQTKREGWQVGPFVRTRDDVRKRYTNVLFPLLVTHSAPEYHAIVQFPFFWRIHDHEETDTVLFPLWGRVRKPGYAADVSFPLFWRFVVGNSATTVAGPFFYHRREATSDGGLVPLFGWGRRAGGSYFWGPLLFHDRYEKSAHTLVLTYFHGRDGGDWTDMLLPLWAGWRRGPRAHVIGIPFYFSRDDEKKDALLIAGPLYRGRSAHSWYAGLFPLLWLHKRDDGAASTTIFPLLHFGRRADGGHLFVTLLGGFSTTAAQDNKYVIGPTYFRFDKGALRSLFLPIPILYHGRDPRTGFGTTVYFPLFLHRTTDESALTAITPLYWRYRTIDTLTNVALLYFDRHDYFKSKSFGVVPFFYHRTELAVAGRADQVLLFYQSRTPTGTDRVLFPLYWHFGRGGDTTDTVLPLFWYWRRGHDTTTLLLPLLAHWSREDGESTLVVNTYYRRGRGVDEGTWSFHFFPLFNVGVPRAGSFEWGLLGGAISVLRTEHGKRLRLFWTLDIQLSGTPPSKRARAKAAPASAFY